MKTAFGKIWMIVMGAIFALTFTACDSNDEKRTEIAKIVESRSCRELLNDLYIGSDGDVETLARMLGVTPSSIERIRRGSTRPTEQFEERVRDVSIYFAHNGQSFSKLRAAIDLEWGWYDSILHWPVHHPWIFGIITFLLLCVCSYAKGELLIEIEIFIFLIAWICSLIFAPSVMEDRYVEMINPIVEQVL